MKRTMWLVVGIVVTQVAFGIALAAPSGEGRSALLTPQVQSDPPGPPDPKRIGYAYPIQYVFYVTETQPYKVNSRSWVNLPGAIIGPSDYFHVSSGGALLIGRFTAQSNCVGQDGYCSVRIMFKRVGGNPTPMNPNAGINFVFDSTADSWDSHSIEQVPAYNVPPGDYSMWVQVSTHPFVGATRRPTFYLDNWTFTAQAAW